MKRTFTYFARAAALALALLMLLTTLLSCTARPLAQTKLAKTEVGRVGDYTVAYEELYFLANTYYSTLKDDHEGDPEGLKTAVWESVNENITANYAILELCKTMGIVYDEDELKDEVEDYLERYIEEGFEGSRKDYLAQQKEMGLTDHYVRFVTGVDLLYDRLAIKYMEDGVVPNSDEELKTYIKDNFVHTCHIAVFVDNGDDREKELAKAEEALAMIRSGEKTVVELLGSRYNEDLIPPTTDYDGYYFPRGVNEKWYEDTAFSLDVGKTSDIVNAMGENSLGQYVECFYVIQRLPATEEDIDSNFPALSDMVVDAIISEDREAIKATLSFEPNDFAKGLDLTDLEYPKNGADVQLILIIALCVVACGCTVTAILLFRYIRKRRFRKTLKK